MFIFGKTKNFCSVQVTFFAVGNSLEMNSIFYLKFLMGVFNLTPVSPILARLQTHFPTSLDVVKNCPKFLA